MIPRWAFLAWLAIPAAAVAAPAKPPAAAAVAEPVSAQTLTGEACSTTPRLDVAPFPGLPRNRTIACGGSDSGELVYAPAPATALAATGDARKAALADAFVTSRAWLTIQQRLSCEEARWLDDGPAPLLAVPCRTRAGGYPDLVLVGVDGAGLAIVDGPASVYPVLRALVKSPAPEEARSDTLTRLLGLWKDPVVLASATDLARIKRLLGDARTAANLARYDQAETLFRQALDTQTRLFSENDTATADILMDLALTVSNQGRGDEADALFRQAATVMERSPNASDRARLETYRGYDAANRGRFGDALLSARVAVDAWRKLAGAAGAAAPAPAAGPNAAAAPQFAGGMGAPRQGGPRGAPRAGGPTLAGSAGGATGISGAGDDAASLIAAQGELAMALNLQAQMELRTGDITTAYASAGEALLLLDKIEGEPKSWKADVLATLGEVSSAQGRLSAAENFLRNALALRFELFGEGVATLKTRVALGRAYQAEGMNTSAVIAYRDAFKAARSMSRDSVPFKPNDLVPFAAAVVDLGETLSDDSARLGLYAEAFDAFQLVRAPTIDKTIGRTSARLAQDNPEIAALLRTIEEAERTQASARLRLAYEQSLASSDRSALVEDKLAADIAAQGKAALEARQALTARFPDFAGLTETQPPTLDQVRAQIAPNEALATFLIGRDRSYAMLIRRDGLTIAPVPTGEAALRSTVQGLRRALEIQGKSVGDFDLDSAHALYRDLFGGLERAMTGVDRLVIVPSGPLSSLPFGLLVTAPAARDDYRGAKWLMRRATLVHAPSIASFVALRATTPAKRPDLPLLAFGNPVLGAAGGGNAQRSALNSVAGGCRTDGPMPAGLLRSLASLPDTATEVAAVAKTLGAGANVNLGAGATEARLRGDGLDRYRVLYFATHGLLPGELKCQGEPGLVLTPPATPAATKADDGLLEASEVASLSLNADLVVLSACNTAAGGASLGGEAMSGLSEAFFHAGARNMIVSHWQVPSAATTALMSGLFGTLGTSSDASGALRTAQMKLADNMQTAHPFFWAAFVLMGAGEMPTASMEAGR